MALQVVLLILLRFLFQSCSFVVYNFRGLIEFIEKNIVCNWLNCVCLRNYV